MHLCLFPVHTAHVCPAAPCYFGATPGSGKLRRPTPHSHSSLQACAFPRKEGRGGGKDPPRPLLSHFSSISPPTPVKGSVSSSFRENPLSPNLFPPNNFGYTPNPLQSSEGIYNTKHNSEKFLVLVLLFILSHHSPTLRQGPAVQGMEVGTGNTKKKNISQSHVYHM